MIWILIIAVLLIGAGVCGWLTSSILHQDQISEIETRKDWGTNGMSSRQCATELLLNSTHFICESKDNHNI